VKPVALEFSADPFRGNLREKDLESIRLNVTDQAHATRKLLFSGFVVLGVLDCGQALLKSANVGRIVREGVIGKASSAGEILREKFGDCFLREAKVGEAFAIRFADKMVCTLHHVLPFFEPFNFIDEFFSSIRVIAKNDHVGLGGGRSPAKVFGFIVMFLRLGEMLLDAVEIFAMAFLRMVPNQNWLTQRDHFKSFPGGEVSPGFNVCVLFGELSKAAQLSLRVLIRNRSCLEEVGLQLQIMCLDSVGCDRRDALIKEHMARTMKPTK
jgi:hypothetical protein